MEQIITGGVISFLVALYAVPIVLRVADQKSLYDIPDERKVHKSPKPSLGGMAIFGGFITGLLLTVLPEEFRTYIQYYTLAFLLIFFIGIKDDLVSISPLKKSIGQIAAASIIVFKSNLVFTSMHGFLGIYYLEPTAGAALTIFTILVIINAFNLIDGVDGLAGSLGLISCIVFGTYFYINNDMGHATLAFTFAASLIAFLIYNFYPARIFMGDTGSMLLGIVNAILVIRFIEMGPQFPKYPVYATPAIGFAILLIPLLDTLRVFAIRMFNRRSPFSPDRNHLHHILLEKGFSHRAIAITLSIASICFTALAFSIQSWGCTLILLFLTSIFFIIIAILISTSPQRKLSIVKIRRPVGGTIRSESRSHIAKIVDDEKQ